MKKNLYDLFADYDGELPELKESPCDSAQIEQLVMTRTAAKPIRRIKHRRLFPAIAAAAAAIAVCGVTVAAATGKLDIFRKMLGKTALTDTGSRLPMMHETSEETMSQYLWEDGTVFAGDSSLNISTVSMYSGQDTLMLMLAIAPQHGQSLPENAKFIPYFYRADGTLLPQSGIANVQALVQDDETGISYLTYYLTAQDLADSTLRVELKNAYSDAQLKSVYAGVQDAQAQWRADLGADSMSVEEWKALWQSEDLDGRTAETVTALLAETEPLLRGTWTAELEIPQAADAPRIFTAEGFTVRADGLSLQTEQQDPDAQVEYMVTLKDGTKILDGALAEDISSEHKALADAGILSGADSMQEFAYRFDNIACFSDPVRTADIASVTALIFHYENGVQVTAVELS